MANQLAVNSPDLSAVVPYYGVNLRLKMSQKLKHLYFCIMLVLTKELIRGFRHLKKL